MHHFLYRGLSGMLFSSGNSGVGGTLGTSHVFINFDLNCQYVHMARSARVVVPEALYHITQ